MWLRTGPDRGSQETFTVHAVPAGLSRRARRARIGKLLVAHGADRDDVGHYLAGEGAVEVSDAESHSHGWLRAVVPPAGTAKARIYRPMGEDRFEVTVSVILADGHTFENSQVVGRVLDPVFDPDPVTDDAQGDWNQGDMRRWLDWVGLKLLEPVPVALGTEFAVQTQVASLQGVRP